jgi:hypothetical protein
MKNTSAERGLEKFMDHPPSHPIPVRPILFHLCYLITPFAIASPKAKQYAPMALSSNAEEKWIAAPRIMALTYFLADGAQPFSTSLS